MNNIIKNSNIIKNLLDKIIKYNEEKIPNLGRWCHINVPKCNHDVLLRKIDMANNDNNLCIKAKNLLETK